MSGVAKLSSDVKPSAGAEPAEEQTSTHFPFPVVGIGASAGGLEAFTQLLNHLPEDSGMAFVLVQHLDPDHHSHLTELLAPATKLPVFEVRDGMALSPNHVYVLPPNANLQLAQGKFRLTPRGPERVPHPVDCFFRSLAQEQHNWAFGVVLSGTGSDGMMGLEEIKAAGGLTFAQDEKSARFSGMPLRAASGAVDFVLPPAQIAAELARLARDPYLARSSKTETEISQETDNAKDFQHILMLLHSQMGVDFRQYRDTTIQRRIQRRMLVHTRPTVREYAQFLETNPDEVKALFEDMLISVTSFFRDPEVFEALKAGVFPHIVKAVPSTVRLWVPACSTGQEVYSLAMALLEFLEPEPATPAIQVFGTDLNESFAIERARRGFYPETIEAEVTPERLRRFFVKEAGGYRVNKTLREMCVFARQNVTADPPFSRMDLISCRNLLIYLKPPLQRRVISTFHYALNPSGYLLLGNSETVGANSDLFELLDRKHKIFSKKAMAIRPFSHFPAKDLKSHAPLGKSAPVEPGPVDFQKEADRILLGRYAPAGVLVNRNLEVLQFRGHTGPYLELPTGEANFNLLKMARGNLPLELGGAVQQAQRESAPVRRRVRWGEKDTARRIHLEVIPLQLSASSESCFLILFDDAERERAAATPSKSGRAKKSRAAAARPAPKQAELKQLRHDLKTTQEYLQTVIEQQDAANEELKCANEEVLSSNEELQSTNEQLGTAKEELQSTNEELTTLNEELQSRNVELSQLNNDLNNLQGSIQIPIVMLGNDLRIRRFNPAASRLLHLAASDIGRSVKTLHSPLLGANLEPALAEVVGQAVQKEREVCDPEGHWFSLRLNPYRTTDNRIDGATMAWIDIEALKRIQELQSATANEAVTEIEDRFRIAADIAPVLIWMSGPDKLCNWFNRPWLEFTGRTMAEECGQGWVENVHPADVSKFRETYESAFDARHNFRMEFRLRRHDGEYRWLLDQGVPRYRGKEFVGYIGSCVDITERKRLEEKLAESLAREKLARQAAERANHAKDDFLAALSHELRTPLNPVLLLASDAAQNAELPAEVRADFETIRTNVELEARLIDDLLDLTQITLGKLSLNLAAVDAHTVLQDAVANVQSELNAKQLELVLELKAEPTLIRGDAVRLQQVFWNVLKNAVKFTPPGGKIVVETSTPGDARRLSIKIMDTGLGMTQKELSRVFTAFSQGDHVRSSSHRFGGLGLGLAIAWRLVKLHSGTIRAASDGRDHGATFIIELPLTQMENDHSPATESAPVNSSSPASVKTTGVRILLVEDHEPTRTALAHLLARRHYEVVTAGSVAEVRKIAEKETFDLVISDIGLPDGSGNELMADLRDRFGLKGIALTGYGMEHDIARSQSAGFVAHLTKPVRVESLEAALTAVVPR